MHGLLGLIGRFGRDERGVFAVIFGVIAIVVVALSGAVVDYVSMEQARSRSQIALDAATLALQPEIFSSTMNEEDIRARAEALVRDRINDPSIEVTINPVEINLTQGSLLLTGRLIVPTRFVGLVGVSSLPATIRAEAQRMMLDLEVAMVLDNSGSMQGTRITNLKTAARCATNILLYDAVHDTTCQPLSAAKVKENVKIGLVPFALMVNIGTQFRNSAWLDWAGISPLASLNFDNDDNQNTPFNGPVNRTNLFAQTNSSWTGCVEARQSPYDTTDDEPDTPEKLFLPLFSPDTYTGLTNNYLSDTGGTCPVRTCTQRVERNNCTTDRRGNVTCSGATLTTYSRNNAGVVTDMGSASCIPSSPTVLSGPTETTSGNKRTTTTTYSLLTPRELQERLCKYNGTNIANSRTNFDCPSAAMLPLSNAPGTITTRINQMSAGGNTNIQQGTIWGVHMLTDSEPLTDALPISDSVSKALIIMSDGENLPKFNNDMNGGTYFSWGFRKDGRLSPNPSDTNTQGKMTDIMDTKTVAACQTAKDLGIRVYVVGLAVSNSVKDMLNDCSSGTDYAHFVENPGELIDVFKRIAGSLSPLRLTQ